jgi:predicted O-methyltransferase YrrM
VAGRANIIKVKGDSARSAEGFPDSYFDFVYIDACHEYEAALADIKAWLPKVKKGGVISGHDYHLEFAGVIKAVQEVFVGRQNVTEYNWWVRL